VQNAASLDKLDPLELRVQNAASLDKLDPLELECKMLSDWVLMDGQSHAFHRRADFSFECNMN
jgi:hypothetical protein